MKSLPLAFAGILIVNLVLAAPAYAIDPIAHWKFDEGTGTTATDSSGNGHDGTISGATYSATTSPDVEFDDPFSLEFDGIDDGVSTPLSLDGSSAFTLAGWAYPRSAAADEGWFGANDVFEFIFKDSETLRCWTSVGAVNWSFAGVDDFLGNWHHITCLGDGDHIILYVDGDQVASTTHAHTDDYGSGDNVSIGLGVQAPGAGPFDGFIDDVRVYDVALTPGEMQSLGTGADEPVDNPIVTALSPSDDETGVSIDADLSLTFSKTVGWESGNILIKNAEDGAIVETIPVGGGPVSGSGTNTLTIDPHADLAYDTEYYVEIPDTAVRDTVDNLFFAGITGTTTWSFTTEEDTVAPVLTEVAALSGQVDADDAVYRFQTDELCEIAVTPPTTDRGAVEPLAEEVVVGTDIGITLEGMEEGGTYSYSISCIDEAGNHSNTLSVGPFTINEPASRGSSRGTSVTAQVKNLLSLGNGARAAELMREYPNLFPEAPSAVAQTSVRDLFAGLEGEDVRMLQTLLIGKGYAIPAGATGFFASQTNAALSAYQRDAGIVPAVGYFGPITRVQMKTAGLPNLWW